jgi:imidazolonepropionase-like amidohydrolase
MAKLPSVKCPIGAALLLIVIGVLRLPAQIASEEGFAFTHVTVIDVERGLARHDQTVVIRGNRIAAAAPSRQTGLVPRGTRIIEARSKYLIPGLWDMHAHGPFSADLFVLHAGHGVTGIRHVGGPLAAAVAFRQTERLKTGDYPMRVRVGALSGPGLDAFEQYPQFPGLAMIVTSPEEGRHAVDALHAAKMDFVKIHTQMTRETWLAIVTRAREVGMPFAGHVPYAVSPAEASDAGQKSIEHLTGVAIACSSDEEKIRREARATPPSAAGTAPRFEHATSERVLSTFRVDKCRALARRFATNRTWQVPTLVVIDPDRCCRRGSDDPRAKYLPAWLVKWWEDTSVESPEKDVSLSRRMFQKRLEIVGILHRSGVPLLAGTDMLLPWVYPGLSLHDELVWFVRAGLSPAEALRTATLNPAVYFERTADLGTVTAGKLADLVLLDADPLSDIGNTRRVRAVVLDGQLFERSTIEKLLDDVAKRAQR